MFKLRGDEQAGRLKEAKYGCLFVQHVSTMVGDARHHWVLTWFSCLSFRVRSLSSEYSLLIKVFEVINTNIVYSSRKVYAWMDLTPWLGFL